MGGGAPSVPDCGRTGRMSNEVFEFLLQETTRIMARFKSICKTGLS